MYVDEQDNLLTPEVVTSTSSMDVNASMDPVHILMMKNRQPVEEKLRYVERKKSRGYNRKRIFSSSTINSWERLEVMPERLWENGKF